MAAGCCRQPWQVHVPTTPASSRSAAPQHLRRDGTGSEARQGQRQHQRCLCTSRLRKVRASGRNSDNGAGSGNHAGLNPAAATWLNPFAGRAPSAGATVAKSDVVQLGDLVSRAAVDTAPDSLPKPPRPFLIPEPSESGREGADKQTPEFVSVDFDSDSEDDNLPMPRGGLALHQVDKVAAVDGDLYYEGMLSDDDDPPGHRSGYITIIGRPNAGKSTLLNALLGQKLSIVSPKAQTTRHRILGIMSDDQSQVILLDTPGVIARKRNHLEARMMSFVKASMKQADALVAIVDIRHEPGELLAMLQPPKSAERPPMLVALNKADLCSAQEVAAAEAWWRENSRCDGIITMSALKGTNVKAVHNWMVANIPEGPTLYPKEQVAEQPEKFFVTEIIREQVFRMYDHEVPYSVTVHMQEFRERKKGKDYINVHLMCERDSHRPILIGKNGSAIKALATAARVQIEDFLQRGVYLEMSVKVSKGWREDMSALKKFGY